jgi:ketosteroid isomerase-like protein
MTSPKIPNETDIAETIIALEKAALERWGNGDPSGFLEICAPDVVYFDPGRKTRLDGKAALEEFYESIRGLVHFERFELLNPLVQVAGDAAVLTFNYVSYDKNGKPSPWNCSEVYRRSGEQWEIIQTHWSYTLSVRAPVK